MILVYLCMWETLIRYNDTERPKGLLWCSIYSLPTLSCKKPSTRGLDNSTETSPERNLYRSNNINIEEKQRLEHKKGGLL